MQLKFKRYTGTRGLVMKDTTYCLEAIALPTPEEEHRIGQFKRASDSVWFLNDLSLDVDSELSTALMKHSINDIVSGVRFEYLNFNNVLHTESAIANACQKYLATMEALASFDGTERVVEVNEDRAKVVLAE